jgi:hypothetical protein
VGQKRNKIVVGGEREWAIEQWRMGRGVIELAALFGVHRNTIQNWIRGRKRSPRRDGEPERDRRDQKIEELELQVGALEGTVGRQAMEIRFFKGALRRIEGSRQQRSAKGGTASTPKSGA